MNLRQALLGFFGGDTSGSAAPHPPAAKDVQPQATHDPGLTGFAKRLEQLLGEKRALLSGNIHLIGLSRIRSEFGDDWPRVAGRAEELTQKEIQRALGPEDIFTPYDDLSFLIIFANLTTEQAQLRCHEISEEIGRKLLGENFSPEASEVKNGVFEVDGSLIFNAIRKKDLLSNLTGRIDSEVLAPSAATDPLDPLGRQEGMPDLSQYNLDKTQALASIRVLYQPMWNMRRKVVANYFGVASAISLFGDQLWDDAVRRNYSGVISSAELDVFVAHTVLRDAAKYLSEGQRAFIGWPVHYETLASRSSRDSYIQLCRALPEAIRNLLVLELDGLPAGVPTSRVLEMGTILRPYCRGLLVRVPADYRRFDVFAGASITGVGFSLSGNAANDGRRIALMERFVDMASRAGLRSYVHGLTSRAQVLAAAAAGFEWVNGLALDQPSEKLGQVRRFDLTEIYTSLK